ncbi:hypothetical protein [Streptomyces sp. NPDC001068]|uniref:hypothetical protein n=1 Tax=Streptomyces sp. NPDC001068 TaxID=3364544 RepID=UPI0036A0E485
MVVLAWVVVVATVAAFAGGITWLGYHMDGSWKGAAQLWGVVVGFVSVFMAFCWSMAVLTA